MRHFQLPLVLVLLLGITSAGQAQDVQEYFQSYCAPCHTIGGGKIVGPDLKGVLDRQDRQWLVDFIVDPDSKLDSDDAYAQELLAAANNVRMTGLGVDPVLANALLDYIVGASASDTPPAPVEEELPFTAADVELGRNYFTGAKAFSQGAPSCTSCHTTASLGAWGGGGLGPDLTSSIGRIGGRRALTGWLTIPGSATMAPVFKEHKLSPEEIDALVAFLEAEDASGAPDAASATTSFLGVGALSTVVLLALFGFLWKDRYNATRIPMVEKSKR
ncbi:MAG: c-type cytochrome [Planctomycetota bacterium]